jgi:hypothetical protein
MKTKYRKSKSANGELDNYAIRAEEYASYVTRKKRPPHVTLERIANLAEKAMSYQHMRTQRHGKLVPDNRPYLQEGRESQRNKVLDRIWTAYQVVQEEEIMHPYAQGKDETWNGAQRNSSGKWVAEPTYYYGDHFDYVIGDEFYGNKAQGRTPIRDSNYNGDEGDDK